MSTSSSAPPTSSVLLAIFITFSPFSARISSMFLRERDINTADTNSHCILIYTTTEGEEVYRVCVCVCATSEPVFLVKPAEVVGHKMKTLATGTLN